MTNINLPCDPFTSPDRAKPYALEAADPFAQVAPEASYWTDYPVLQTLPFKAVWSDPRVQQFVTEGYPTVGSQRYQEEEEILRDFAGRRDQPFSKSDLPLSVFLTHKRFSDRLPAGATFSSRVVPGAGAPIVTTGTELASLFETEKVAVWHQHSLVTLMDAEATQKTESGETVTLRMRDIIPPPRQALMQMALHVAVFSALCAVWHFKWRATGKMVSRRQRPIEGLPNFTVVYDQKAIPGADPLIRDPKVQNVGPCPSPGSPRHPAFGSGHSTYSRAASEVLKLFLPQTWGDVGDLHLGLDQLAENIGYSRLWAGVHWKYDHEFGKAIGDAIATDIRRQLNESVIRPRDLQQKWHSPPSDAAIDADKQLAVTMMGKQGWGTNPPSLTIKSIQRG